MQVEKWALPQSDEAVMSFYESQISALSEPVALNDVMNSLDEYCGLFIPGGHGSMLGLPDSLEVGNLISDMIVSKKPVMAQLFLLLLKKLIIFP